MRAELLPSCLMLLSRDSETRWGWVTDQGSVVSSNPRLVIVGGPAAPVVVVEVTSDVVVLSVVGRVDTVAEIDVVAVGSCDEVVMSTLLSAIVKLISTVDEVSVSKTAVVVASSAAVVILVLLSMTVELCSVAGIIGVVVVGDSSVVVGSTVLPSVISKVSSLAEDVSVVIETIVVVSFEKVGVSVRLPVIVELNSAVKVIETATVVASSVTVVGSTLLSIIEDVRAILYEVVVVKMVGEAAVVVLSFDSVDVCLVLSDWSVVKVK